jgi:hypothetical protein
MPRTLRGLPHDYASGGVLGRRSSGEETIMAWSWRYEDGAGKATAGPAESFASQADAESWIGQQWRELLNAGVVAVSLVDDDRVEYKMSLQPAGQ